MTDTLSVLLIGAGNMGGALFSAWVKAGVLDPKRSAVLDPGPSDRLIDLCDAGGIALNPVDDPHSYDLCILGVKPQMFGKVLPDIAFNGANEATYVSIAAGLGAGEIANLLKGVSADPQVVRTMPNLPASAGEGMTLLFAPDGVDAGRRAQVGALFSAAGEIVWTQTEDELDRLMGVSGCGPAFLYHVVEALEAAARAQGADQATARLLAEQTVIGAAAQLKAEDRTATELRAAVTSPGGTTAAGLGVLMEERALEGLFVDAVEAAYLRAGELGA